jgi:23S rRNA (pseudouridine1915-N3)-methyltransferase
MVLYIVAVGRMSDPALRAACADYAARVRRVWGLEIREVRSPAGRFPAAERTRREGERLLEALPPGVPAVALTPNGRTETSEGFARRLAACQADGRGIAFVLGGADGLDPQLMRRCELALSLSPLTFPHELARLILLEQLYRGSTILRGTPYHRGR